MNPSYLLKVIQHMRGRNGLRPLNPNLLLKTLPNLDPLLEKSGEH